MGEPTGDRYQEIKVSLAALYNAGRRLIPDKADETSDCARDVDVQTEALDSAAASANNPQPLLDALATCDDVYDALTQMVKTLNYAADGLVHVANAFAGRDGDAATAANHLQKGLAHGHKPRLADVPADNGNPVTGGFQPAPPPESPRSDLDDRNRELDQDTNDVNIPNEVR